jgi:hypothetical protein
MVKKWMIVKLVVPYIAYQLIFLLYVFGDNFPFLKTKWWSATFAFMLVVISIHFLLQEYQQHMASEINDVSYFLSFWNWVDSVPCMLIIGVMFLRTYKDFTRVGEVNEDFSNMWLTIAYLLINAKFVYFLKMERQTAKFIKVFEMLASDLAVFGMIFLIVVYVFSMSFCIIFQYD